MKFTITANLIVLLVSISLGEQLRNLDDTSWNVTVIPDKDTAALPGAKEFADVLTFADKKFSSRALTAKDFKPVTYRGDFEEREAEFEAEQESQADGVVIWLGEVRGGRIVGRLQWRKTAQTCLQLQRHEHW